MIMIKLSGFNTNEKNDYFLLLDVMWLGVVGAAVAVDLVLVLGDVGDGGAAGRGLGAPDGDVDAGHHLAPSILK